MGSDDDSDSDDSMLKAAPTFSKKRTRSSKETEASRTERILEQAMKFSNENLSQHHKISQLQKEEVDSEDLVAKTRQIQEHNNKKSRKANLDVVEGIEQAVDYSMGTTDSKKNDYKNNKNNTTNVGKDKANDDRPLDRDRRLALVRVADTVQCSNLGVRSTLFRVMQGDESSSSSSCPDLPQTWEHAIEYLTHVLATTGAVASKVQKEKILDPLVQELLDVNNFKVFLSDGILAKICRDHKISSLPIELMEWLFLVACTGAGSGGAGNAASPYALANLSEGAYATLCELWTLGVTPDRGVILQLSDLSSQLEHWFGYHSRAGVTNPQQAPTQTIQSAGRDPKVKGLCSFLKLWEVALAQGLVALNDQALEQACTSLKTLVLAGLDGCFHSVEA
jgi:hypothetical protein